MLLSIATVRMIFSSHCFRKQLEGIHSCCIIETEWGSTHLEFSELSKAFCQQIHKEAICLIAFITCNLNFTIVLSSLNCIYHNMAKLTFLLFT